MIEKNTKKVVLYFYFLSFVFVFSTTVLPSTLIQFFQEWHLLLSSIEDYGNGLEAKERSTNFNF